MVFARLDVYWPDGRFESYMLEGDTVSVGRAPGNTIPIESDTISRYHFSIVHQDDQVSITDLDSENGTFVDGVRLQSNAPFMLENVEEIQAGHLRIIYHPVDDDPTLPVSPLTDDDTLRVEREDANFRLALDMSRIRVWPAASSSVELAITSTSDETRRFSVNVEGVPQKWLRINRPELELNPNETGYVLINVKPPRRSDNEPESFEMLVQVEPLDNPLMMLEAAVQLDLQSYSGFGVALATPTIESDENFRLYLHNQGSSPLNVVVTGHSVDKNVPLTFNMPESELTLAAGQRLQVNGTVTGKRALLGSASSHAFDLRVKAQNAAGFMAVTRGTVTLQPRMPLWTAISAGGIVASLVLIAVLALSGALLPPANPTIENLTLSNTEFVAGDLLELDWESDDIETLRVFIAGEEIASLDGDIQTASIDTTPYNGSVLLRLVAENRGVTTEETRDIFIYPPMSIESFTVTPDSVVRNVVTALTISWNVPGAVLTRISGLDTFTNAPLQSSYEAATNTLEGIGGIPEDTLAITLFAEDALGNTLEQTFDLTISNPTCTAQTDVTLREGPDARHQVIATLTIEETVIVNAQDAEAGWLRVVLPGDIAGWGEKTAFVCSENFALNDLRTELDVLPPPTPVPTQPPTATALPTVIPTATGQ